MMLDNAHSLCEERQKKIISRDTKSRCEHRAHNPERNLVRHYQIDGGVIVDKTVQKCDFLLLNDDKKNAYLIELKGTHILKTLQQLEETEKHLREDLKAYTLHYRIVYKANTHAIRGSEYNKFCKAKNNRVKASTNLLEETV